jgi:hypothetical protein
VYLGKLVELGPTEQVLADPAHPYTQALLAAVPEPDPRRRPEATQLITGSACASPSARPAPDPRTQSRGTNGPAGALNLGPSRSCDACERRLVAVTVEPTALDARAELDRQTAVLVDKGCPAAAGMSEAAFRRLVAPLRQRLPVAGEFVLVVTRTLVPVERLLERTSLKGKPGFTTMDADDIRAFSPTADVRLPDSPVYLLTDVDTGGDTRNVTPDEALPRILAAGRTPLTLDEGLAVVLQHPEWLRERNCFEMLGSRAGDRRVTGLWVSAGAPRLGWCWAGNPHSWLGMATAADRVA